MTDNVPSTDAGKAREGLIDELETINNYEEMASKTSDPKLRAQFEEITDDERVHVGNFAEMIANKDPKAEPLMRKGLEEVKKACPMFSFQEMMCGVSHFEKKRVFQPWEKKPDMINSASSALDVYRTNKFYGSNYNKFHYPGRKVQNLINDGRRLIRKQNLPKNEYPYSRTEDLLDLMMGKSIIARPGDFKYVGGKASLPNGWSVYSGRNGDRTPVILNEHGRQMIWKGGELKELTPKGYEHLVNHKSYPREANESAPGFSVFHEVPTRLPRYLERKFNNEQNKLQLLYKTQRMLEKGLGDIPTNGYTSQMINRYDDLIENFSDYFAGGIRGSGNGTRPYSLGEVWDRIRADVEDDESLTPDDKADFENLIRADSTVVNTIMIDGVKRALEKLYNAGFDESALRRYVREFGDAVKDVIVGGEGNVGPIASKRPYVPKDFKWKDASSYDEVNKTVAADGTEEHPNYFPDLLRPEEMQEPLYKGMRPLTDDELKLYNDEKMIRDAKAAEEREKAFNIANRQDQIRALGAYGFFNDTPEWIPPMKHKFDTKEDYWAADEDYWNKWKNADTGEYDWSAWKGKGGTPIDWDQTSMRDADEDEVPVNEGDQTALERNALKRNNLAYRKLTDAAQYFKETYPGYAWVDSLSKDYNPEKLNGIKSALSRLIEAVPDDYSPSTGLTMSRLKNAVNSMEFPKELADLRGLDAAYTMVDGKKVKHDPFKLRKELEAGPGDLKEEEWAKKKSDLESKIANATERKKLNTIPVAAQALGSYLDTPEVKEMFNYGVDEEDPEGVSALYDAYDAGDDILKNLTRTGAYDGVSGGSRGFEQLVKDKWQDPNMLEYWSNNKENGKGMIMPVGDPRNMSGKEMATARAKGLKDLIEEGRKKLREIIHTRIFPTAQGSGKGYIGYSNGDGEWHSDPKSPTATPRQTLADVARGKKEGKTYSQAHKVNRNEGATERMKYKQFQQMGAMSEEDARKQDWFTKALSDWLSRGNITTVDPKAQEEYDNPDKTITGISQSPDRSSVYEDKDRAPRNTAYHTSTTASDSREYLSAAPGNPDLLSDKDKELIGDAENYAPPNIRGWDYKVEPITGIGISPRSSLVNINLTRDDKMTEQSEPYNKSASFEEMLKSATAKKWEEKGLPSGSLEKTLPAYYRTVTMGCDKDAINVYEHQKMPAGGDGISVKKVPGIGPKMSTKGDE